MTETLLKINGITKYYGNKCALNGVTLTINKGRIIGLLGPNGSGKTTLIKLVMGLLTPDQGELSVLGHPIGIESKASISYLPDRTYLNESMRVKDIIDYFVDFYSDFDPHRAYNMLGALNINAYDKLKTMSKGTKEKVQLVLVMSRRAALYILDEPIAGVDPAARDYIINTILQNYDETASIIISTHLITDIENILDDVIFIKEGQINMSCTVDELREKEGKSVDATFREVFRC
ncbi:MAG: ABC transporter ATP-binding protein [Lachnospiraceae bacterium]|nr:ABC transporter ATP-binding protein [Lachnospiraceae bacterium]